MMMVAAGAGQTARPLYMEPKRPIPKWVWGAVAASALVHAAGAVWLYNQRYDMPAPVAPPTQDHPIITMERLPEPPVIEDTAPSRPPPPIHQPTQAPDRPVETSPFVAPDEPTAPVEAGLPLVDPTPNPVEGGTSVEPSPPSPPAVIRNPTWVRTPTAGQMQRAYPTRAAENGVSGQVTLRCSVTASGAVTDCTVGSETPAGEGFGRAALSLSRYFVMSPRTVDGRPVEGARVNIPLSFGLSG